MEIIKKVVELNVLKPSEGKLLIHKDEFENREEDTVLVGSKEIYLSSSDSAENYIEIEEE